MLDCQIALLKQVEYKSQLSGELTGEYITRFGFAAYNALPEYPGAPEPDKRKRKTPLQLAEEVLG